MLINPLKTKQEKKKILNKKNVFLTKEGGRLYQKKRNILL